MKSILWILGVILLAHPVRADYSWGLSPIGFLDGMAPELAFTAYPPDSIGIGGRFDVGFILVDQLDISMRFELAGIDSLGSEIPLTDGDLLPGTYSRTIDLPLGEWSLVLRARDSFGNHDEILGGVFHVVGTDVDVPLRPHRFTLENPVPNPFNPVSRLYFTLPDACSTTLGIYNLRGQCVRTLVDGHLQQGRYGVEFDGSGLPSGIYLARLSGNGMTATTRLTLLK